MEQVKQELIKVLAHYRISDKEGRMGGVGKLSDEFYHDFKIKTLKTKIQILDDNNFVMLEVKNLDDVKNVDRIIRFTLRNNHKIK